MTPRDSAGPVRSLKFVTLLVALSPDLLRWGAGLQLRDNGYEELLVALHPQVSEDPSLIPHIKVSGLTEGNTILLLGEASRLG